MMKVNDKSTVIVIVLAVGLALAFIPIQYAFADIPNINTFVADDPDDGDTVYSNGDTFTLTFSLPINVTASAPMSQGAITGNFTLSGGASFGTTFSGQWSADRLTLVITVTNVAGATTPIIGTTTISASGTSNLGHAGDPPTSSTLTGAPTLGGDYGLFVAVSSGANGGCRGDCFDSPTLGVDDNGRRIVTNGFTYNGNPIDVEKYFTPYPLITVDVGVKNTAKFKIYEDSGPQSVRHFELAFGIANGQTIHTSTAVIKWDKTFSGIETVTTVDPDNVLQDVDVRTTTGKCSESGGECLIITVDHTFRAPPEFNIVGTNVWDEERNGWQNYYNDGIAVVGESMNPPKQHTGINMGQLITITETGKNKAIDSDGNTWTFDKEWIMDYVPQGKIIDKISSHGYDRNHALFGIYKQGQELLAKQTIDEFCEKCSDESFAEMYDIFTYDFPQRIDKMDDPKVQKKIMFEISKAEKILANMS